MTDEQWDPKEISAALVHRHINEPLEKIPFIHKDPRVEDFLEIRRRKRWKAKVSRQGRRHKAILKVANNHPPVCTICKCPHVFVLTFGHYKNNGKEHREHIKEEGHGDIIGWILKMPINIISAQVQLECIYCNFFHAYQHRYPDKHEQPTWPTTDQVNQS